MYLKLKRNGNKSERENSKGGKSEAREQERRRRDIIRKTVKGRVSME